MTTHTTTPEARTPAQVAATLADRYANRSPYGIARAAAMAAAAAAVVPEDRHEYIRRRAYLATRRAFPELTADAAFDLARSVQAMACYYFA